jgi:LysR family nitrogen assimilation transcriptional regulator
MDFGDLQGFAAVARLGSFARAATHLRIAQSALSRRVKRLEYQFGTQLLERHSRGVVPTEAGQMLLGKVDALERDLKQVQEDMLALKDSLVGEVTLALPHAVTQFLTRSIIEFYRRRCPEVKLRIVEAKSSDSYDAVVSGAVDVALVCNPEPRSELTTVPLYYEQLLVVGPADPNMDVEGLQDMKTCPGKLLATLPLILPSRQHANQIRLAAERAADKCGVVLHVPIEVDGLSARKMLVKSGLGYTLLANGSVQQDVAAQALTARLLVDPQIEFLVGLVHRNDRRGSRVLRELTENVRCVVYEQPREGFWRPAEHSRPEQPSGERWRRSMPQWPSLAGASVVKPDTVSDP